MKTGPYATFVILIASPFAFFISTRPLPHSVHSVVTLVS
jgi:hypothetical protein